MAIHEVRPDEDQPTRAAAYIRVDDTPALPPALRSDSIDLQNIDKPGGLLRIARQVIGLPDSEQRALQKRLTAHQTAILQDHIHRLNDEVQFRSEMRDAESAEATFNELDPYLRRHPEGTVMGNYYRRMLKRSVEIREADSQSLHDAGVQERRRLIGG